MLREKEVPSPKTDAYLESRVQRTNTKSWYEFARELEWEIAALIRKAEKRERKRKGD